VIIKPIKIFPYVKMSIINTSISILRLLPLLTSSWVLAFAYDEHIFLGTWTRPEYKQVANIHLPAWFQLWGRRGRWTILLGYPSNYLLAILNLLVARSNLYAIGATKWYALGLLFSFGHIAIFGKTAIGLLADIKNDRPKGNSTHSMEVWLKMNMIRAFTTDLPAWLCFAIAVVKGL
jgi:hypothetical protein